MCGLQSGLVFLCWFFFLHKLHDGQLQPARGSIMQVVSSRNLVIYYRSLVFGHLSGMPSRYIVVCSRCNICGYLQQVPFRNLLKLDRRLRCQPVFPLRSWILLNLCGANFSQELCAMSCRHVFTVHCSGVTTNMRSLPCWFILYVCEHCVHSMSTEFFFI